MRSVDMCRALVHKVVNHTRNRRVCLGKVEQVPHLVLQVVDTIALRPQPVEGRRLIPTSADGRTRIPMPGGKFYGCFGLPGCLR